MNRFTKFFRACVSTVQGMPNATAQHAFKGLQDWIEIFRSGTHVDSQGRQASFVNGDLDQMVANVKLGKPPAVIGHPKHNDPAYGWAELKREGDSLFAKFEDVNPAFAAGVDSGAYRNRSVRVVKDAVHGWLVDHVGWLGAARPALTGLQPLSYSAPEAVESYEFAAEAPAWDTGYALSDVASALRGLRDHLIATVGIEAADAAVPDWRITSITDAANRIRSTPDDDMGGIRPFTAHTGADMPGFSQEDLDRTAAETEARVRRELAVANPAQAAEFAAQSAELQRLRSERQAERIATQINAWKAAGRLLPAEEAGLAEFMAALEGGQAGTFEFAAAGAAEGAAKAKKTPAEFFAEFVAARGRLVKLGKTEGEDPGPGNTGGLNTSDARAIAAAAQDFQAAEAKSGRVISIDVAVAHVVRSAKA